MRDDEHGFLTLSVSDDSTLVPNPRANLTRYHGVFAPNHHWREEVTPARRGRRPAVSAEESPINRHAAMSWAQRLKRVFKMDVETCEICGGTMRVIASREDPAVIKRFLAPLENGRGVAQHPEHPPRAPPQLTLTRPRRPRRPRSVPELCVLGSTLSGYSATAVVWPPRQ